MPDLKDRLSYHTINESQQDKMNQLRTSAIMLGTVIRSTSKQSRERSLAETKLEECLFWANKAVALEKEEN